MLSSFFLRFIEEIMMIKLSLQNKKQIGTFRVLKSLITYS